MGVLFCCGDCQSEDAESELYLTLWSDCCDKRLDEKKREEALEKMFKKIDAENNDSISYLQLKQLWVKIQPALKKRNNKCAIL